MVIKKLVALMLISFILTAGCIFQEEEKKGEEWKEKKYVVEAVFITNPQVAVVNDSITFDATGSKGEIEGYWWDFNLSGIVKFQKGEAIVSHAYRECGVYKVALKVIDKEGAANMNSTFVYVNYEYTHHGNITLEDGNKTYLFPVKNSANNATLVLTYNPEGPFGVRVINLDLYVYAKRNNTYELVATSNKTKDGGEERVEITRYDVLYHEEGKWKAEVEWKWKRSPVPRIETDYTLSIEVHYEPHK